MVILCVFFSMVWRWLYSGIFFGIRIFEVEPKDKGETEDTGSNSDFGSREGQVLWGYVQQIFVGWVARVWWLADVVYKDAGGTGGQQGVSEVRLWKYCHFLVEHKFFYQFLQLLISVFRTALLLIFIFIFFAKDLSEPSITHKFQKC